MLTGPVTMLEWSFVRDDQPLGDTCEQLALAIRDEVEDLEKADIQVIQVDEPAIREGLPLRRDRWDEYLELGGLLLPPGDDGRQATRPRSRRICVTRTSATSWSRSRQMDADVNLIEAARSRMELLHDWERTGYRNDIGPGVYDIHSPRVPTVEEMVELLQRPPQGPRPGADLGQPGLRPEDPHLGRGRPQPAQHGAGREAAARRARSGRLTRGRVGSAKNWHRGGRPGRPFGRRGAATSRAGCALRPLATSSSCRHFGLSAPSGVCDPP